MPRAQRVELNRALGQRRRVDAGEGNTVAVSRNAVILQRLVEVNKTLMNSDTDELGYGSLPERVALVLRAARVDMRHLENKLPTDGHASAVPAFHPR